MKLNPINFFAFIFSLFFANTSVAADSDLIVFDWGGYEDPGFFGSYVEKYGDDLWLWVKGQSNLEIAGFSRNLFK